MRDLIVRFLVLALVLAGCSPPANQGDGDGDLDADVDSDGDGDGDSGEDADLEPDADADQWQCACPSPLPACQAPDRVAFSSWDDAALVQVLQVIACARTSLDIAIYQVGWPCLVDGILAAAAANPGLQVRLVTEEENCRRADGDLLCDLARLEAAGVAEVVLDDRSYLMHHKLVIADGALAFVGSANWTEQSYCQDHNGTIVIEDEVIVAALAGEFERLHGGEFGDASWPEPFGGEGMDLYFSPAGDDWQAELLRRIGQADSRIRFMVFAFTLENVAEALVAAAARGVDVRGAVGSSFARETAVLAMREAGIEVLDGAVHHKTVLIEDRDGGTTLVTGSGNLSNAARRNNELVLFIDDDAELTAAFAEEFDRVHEALAP